MYEVAYYDADGRLEGIVGPNGIAGEAGNWAGKLSAASEFRDELATAGKAPEDAAYVGLWKSGPVLGSFRDLEDTTDHTEELRKTWPDKFQQNYDNEVFVIAACDRLGGMDLVGESNVERIHEDYDWTHINYHNFGDYVGVYVDLIDEDVAEELDQLMRGLEDYPLYDDGDHSEREYKALTEYLRYDLAGDLYRELKATDHEVWERVQAWLQHPTNHETIMECYFGSVEDCPIDTEKLAAALPESVTKL